jgi:hypothetical protein
LKLTSCTIIKNRQDACSTGEEFSCGTGILPVHKRLIDNTQDACSTGEEFSCGTGILPVHKRLIDNTARAELKSTRQEF